MRRGGAARWRDRTVAALLMAALAGCGGGDETAPPPASGAPDASAGAATASAPAPADTSAPAPADTSAPAPATAAAPVDAQAFVASADERCSRTFVELDGVEYPDDDALASAAQPFREVARINREQLEDLRSIAPPAGDEEIIADLLDTASAGVDALDALVLAATADDAAAFDRALAEVEQRATQTYDRASAYGFATCFLPPAG